MDKENRKLKYISWRKVDEGTEKQSKNNKEEISPAQKHNNIPSLFRMTSLAIAHLLVRDPAQIKIYEQLPDDQLEIILESMQYAGYPNNFFVSRNLRKMWIFIFLRIRILLQ